MSRESHNCWCAMVHELVISVGGVCVLECSMDVMELFICHQ